MFSGDPFSVFITREIVKKKVMYLFFSSVNMNMRKEIIINMSKYIYVWSGDVFILLRTWGTWCTSAPVVKISVNEKLSPDKLFMFSLVFFSSLNISFASKKIIHPQIQGTWKDYAD